MSRSFVWLPIPADKELQQFAFEICNNVGSAFFGQAKMLPFARNEAAPPGFDGQTASWKEVGRGADDRLMILGHGLGSLVTQLNTDLIGWKAAEVVKWRYDKLAEVISENLDAGRRTQPITYELLVCFGANQFFGKDAFGAKLASTMGQKGLRGVVWAYKGGVILNGTLPTLITHGTSRITSLGKNTDIGQLKAAVTTDENGAVSVDKKSYFDGAKQRVKYPIT